MGKKPATETIKTLGDINLKVPATISLYVIRKKAKKDGEGRLQPGELAFKFGLVDVDREGKPMPAFRFVNVPRELATTVKEGEEYHARVINVRRTGKVHNIRGTEREAIRVLATDFVRHERYSDIREGNNTLFRDVYCGGNVVRRESIPVRIEPRTYRYGHGLVYTVEILVGNQVVLRRLSRKDHSQTLIMEKYSDLLPELSPGQYKTLGRYYGTFENMQTLHENSKSKEKQKARHQHAEAAA